MNSFRYPVAVEPQPAVKPEGKKLRRKLQKIPQRNSYSFTTNLPKATESKSSFLKSALFSWKNDTAKADRRATIAAPLPFEMDKWDDCLRTSRYNADEVEFLAQPHMEEIPSPAQDIVPELAHLSVASEKSRKSSETVSTSGPGTPSTTASVASSRRRHAKTPVTRIGQLEAVASHRALSPKNEASIEQLAESYRALLHSRASFLEERFMTPFQYFDDVPSDLGARAWDIRPATPLEWPLVSKLEVESPTSSDGTLVGHDEDIIYFKPDSAPNGSTLAEPIGHPCQQRDQPRTVGSMASILPENPTVPIIFDLLTKELTAAAGGNLARPGSETSSLQIWVMIEAYEKLRERVEHMDLEPHQAQSVQAMFSMWLSTLHAIHDNMTGYDGSQSESNYGE